MFHDVHCSGDKPPTDVALTTPYAADRDVFLFLSYERKPTEAGRLPGLTVAGAADPRVIVLADVTLFCLHAKGRPRPLAD